MIIVDYFFRYIELIEVRSQTAESVINVVKSIFARHGIPSVFVWQCFAASQFPLFVTECGFQHRTSSTRFAQNNREAEQAVRTAKSMLDKYADIYLALIAPHISIGEWLFTSTIAYGKTIEVNCTIFTGNSSSYLSDLDSVSAADKHAKLRQKEHFNQHHHVHLLPIRA